MQCFAHFDSLQLPIRDASHCHSASDHSFIHQETQRLLREGKIRPSRSSWRSQDFVVCEANKKPRMVVDYSQTVNCIMPLDAYPIPLVPDLLDHVNQFKIFSYIDLKLAFHQFWLDPGESHLTAFEANNCLYEFVCVPFVYTTALWPSIVPYMTSSVIYQALLSTWTMSWWADMIFRNITLTCAISLDELLKLT